jgi:hypothetical protein
MATTNYDALYTIRGLLVRVRADAGQKRSPLGYRKIRRAIDTGELPAADFGHGDVVRWGDFLAWMARRAAARRPAKGSPDRAARVEASVMERLRRERESE